MRQPSCTFSPEEVNRPSWSLCGVNIFTNLQCLEKVPRKGTTDIFNSNTQNQWHLRGDSTVQFNIGLIVLGPDCDTHSCRWRELRTSILVKGYKRKKKEKTKKKRRKKKHSSSQVRSASSSSSSSRWTCSSRINTCRIFEESSWISEGWGWGLLRFLKEKKQGRCCNPFSLNCLCSVVKKKILNLFWNIILHFFLLKL